MTLVMLYLLHLAKASSACQPQSMPLMITSSCLLSDIASSSKLRGFSSCSPRSVVPKLVRRCQPLRSSSSQSRRELLLCESMKTLVSFDVDGTLIRTVGDNANKLHKLAFMQAWKEIYGIDTNLDVIQHHGNTDPLILIRVAEFHGIAKSDAAAKLKEMEDVMLKYYMANADKAGVGLECLPGVKQLLQELKDREDVLTCLVTGNLQPIGWAKMEALGIKHLFSEPYFGGFGSDYCNPDNSDQSWKDRAELVKIAAEKAQKHFPGVQFKAKWHVGDTPMDVQAAQGGHAKALGVLTGVYSRQDLEGCGAESITLENLEDVPAVLKALNL